MTPAVEMTAVADYDAFRGPKAAAHVVNPVHIATTPSVELTEERQPACQWASASRTPNRCAKHMPEFNGQA
jgi:hypothetical protein